MSTSSSITIPDLDIFSKIPWCQDLLSDPEMILVPTDSRTYNSQTTEDAVFGRTLNSPETIDACISMYRRPIPSQTASVVNELVTLLSLQYGVNGHPNICHGGITATIMDEVMGMLLGLYKDQVFGPGPSPTRLVTMTVYLNVTYVKPVETPQVVLVRAKMREVSGRKYFLDAEMMNGRKEVLATATALFVSVKGKDGEKKL